MKYRQFSSPPSSATHQMTRQTPPKRRTFLNYALLSTAFLSTALLYSAYTTLAIHFPILHPSTLPPAHYLNIPAYANKSLPATIPHPHPNHHPSSLISLYHKIRNNHICAREPYLPTLRDALSTLTLPRREQTLIRRDDVLLLHLQSHPSPSLSNPFLSDLTHLAQKFALFLILPSRSPNATRQDEARDLVSLHDHLHTAPVELRLASLRADSDKAVALIRAARHFFAHRGPTSALGALVCDGTVYYGTGMAEYIQNNEFRWLLRHARPAIPKERGKYYWHFRAMGAVTPSCCRFETYGKGDGAKVVCANAPALHRRKCWVASLGSMGRWGFERGIVENTHCSVHTFDCRGSWKVPADLANRVTIHKLCVGIRDDARKDFVSWEQVVDIGGGSLPAILKMDIEGYEFPVMKEMIADGKLLPEQIAVEVHANKAIADAVDTHFHVVRNAGYRLVHRADNPFCAPCSQITLVRREILAEM